MSEAVGATYRSDERRPEADRLRRMDDYHAEEEEEEEDVGPLGYTSSVNLSGNEISNSTSIEALSIE